MQLQRPVLAVQYLQQRAQSLQEVQVFGGGQRVPARKSRGRRLGFAGYLQQASRAQLPSRRSVRCLPWPLKPQASSMLRMSGCCPMMPFWSTVLYS